MNLGEHEGPEDTIYWLNYAESDRVIVNIESWFSKRTRGKVEISNGRNINRRFCRENLSSSVFSGYFRG